MILHRSARWLLSSAILLAAAAGCQSTPDLPVEWVLHSESDEASLFYGQDETDNVALGFRCHRGSGLVTVTAFPGETKGVTPLIRSGSAVERLPAAVEWAHGVESFLSEADLLIDSPLLRAFEAQGQLRVAWPRRHVFDATDRTSRKRVRRFFQACRALAE